MHQKFKKVALVSSGLLTTEKPPPSLAFLSGVCEKVNVEYDVFDLNIQLLHKYGRETYLEIYEYYQDFSRMPDNLKQKLDDYLFETAKKLVDSGIDCLAITLLSIHQIDLAEMFLPHVRKLSDKVTIIAGGPGISTTKLRLADACMNDETNVSVGRTFAINGIVDYYATGEGDIVFEKFLNGERDMPGLNTKDNVETWQPQIENLDNNPVWTYKKINFDLYDNNKSTPTITITGSRGCVRRCSFCDIGHHWKKFRFRSGENIAAEILKHHVEVNTTDFFFSDSLINGSISEFMSLLETIIEYKKQYPSLASINLAGQFIIRGRAHHPERMFQLMRDAGCNHLQIGVESGSEAVRNHMGKKFSNDDIDYHFEMCEKYNVASWIFMMVSYPTETRQDFEDTLNMYRRYQKYLINGTIAGTSCPGPMYVLSNMPLANQMTDLEIEYYHGSETEWFSRKNPTLTLKERHKRYIEFIRTVVSLGYPVQSEIFQDLDMKLLRYRIAANDAKKVFNIAVDQSIYS